MFATNSEVGKHFFFLRKKFKSYLLILNVVVIVLSKSAPWYECTISTDSRVCRIKEEPIHCAAALWSLLGSQSLVLTFFRTWFLLRRVCQHFTRDSCPVVT